MRGILGAVVGFWLVVMVQTPPMFLGASSRRQSVEVSCSRLLACGSEGLAAPSLVSFLAAVLLLNLS